MHLAFNPHGTSKRCGSGEETTQNMFQPSQPCLPVAMRLILLAIVVCTLHFSPCIASGQGGGDSTSYFTLWYDIAFLPAFIAPLSGGVGVAHHAIIGEKGKMIIENRVGVSLRYVIVESLFRPGVIHPFFAGCYFYKTYKDLIWIQQEGNTFADALRNENIGHMLGAAVGLSIYSSSRHRISVQFNIPYSGHVVMTFAFHSRLP